MDIEIYVYLLWVGLFKFKSFGFWYVLFFNLNEINKIISMKLIVIEFICFKVVKIIIENFIVCCYLLKFVYIIKIRIVC